MYALETLAPYVASSHFRDTALFERPGPYGGKGRPPKKGRRLPAVGLLRRQSDLELALRVRRENSYT